MRPATLLAIARRNDDVLPRRHRRGPARALRVPRLPPLHRGLDPDDERAAATPADFRQVVVDYAAEASAHGAVYLEAIFCPIERVRRGCSWQEIYEGVCDGADAARELHGVEVRLTPDIPRGFPIDEARATVEWAARYRDRGVVGVGLGGLEAEYPPEPYEDVFRLAKSLGLGSVPHAGEVAGAASVRGALEELGADRLRHGIRAEEDPGARPRARRPRDRTRRLPALESPHRSCPFAGGPPAAAPRRRRRPLLVSTDDPAMFDTDLTRDYEAAESFGLDPRVVLRDAVARRALRRGDPGATACNRRIVRLENRLVRRYIRAYGVAFGPHGAGRSRRSSRPCCKRRGRSFGRAVLDRRHGLSLERSVRAGARRSRSTQRTTARTRPRCTSSSIWIPATGRWEASRRPQGRRSHAVRRSTT